MLRPAEQVTANRGNAATGLALAEVTKPSARVAVFWAGALPYFADRPSIDLLGECNREIARLPPDLTPAPGLRRVLPGHTKYDLETWVRSAQPDYVQGFRWKRDDVSVWGMEHYVSVRYHRRILCLRKDSDAIDWRKLDGAERVPLDGS